MNLIRERRERNKWISEGIHDIKTRQMIKPVMLRLDDDEPKELEDRKQLLIGDMILAALDWEPKQPDDTWLVLVVPSPFN